MFNFCVMSKLYQPIQKELKEAIIDLVKKGLSYREVEKLTGVSHASVCGIIKAYKKNGKGSSNSANDLLRLLGKKKEEGISESSTTSLPSDCGEDYSNISNIDLIGLVIKRFSVKNQSALARALGVSQPYISKVWRYTKQRDFLKKYQNEQEY